MIKSSSIYNIAYKYLAVLIILTCTTLVSFAQTTDTYISSGTWIAPAGVTSVTVECWGGGGAGGGNTTAEDGGGGAGGGAYSRSDITVIPGNSYTVTVGAGGIAISGGTGGDGGDSWFINTSTILAKGGTGGNPPVGGAAGVAGSGGLSSQGIGTTKYSGGNGGIGADFGNGAGGGGGSSAGSGVDGNNGSAAVNGNPGVGGTAPVDGGAGGDGDRKSAPGNPGFTPGGAGGGAGASGGAGGAGADGQVKITYTPLSDNCPESTSVTPPDIQILCQGDGSNQLTATITNSGGSGTPTHQYQWYYNISNSNTVIGATLLSGETNSTYTPPTTVSEVGSRWYFCVGYATDNGCLQSNEDQDLASNAVEVTVSGTPTTANAGGPQTICDGDAATLGANAPSVGTGSWSVVSGPSTNLSQFSSTSSESAVFTPDGNDGSYVLRWTISNDPCTASTDDVTITVNAPPTTSIAGGPQTICDGSGATMTANSPLVGSGEWSVVSGPSSNLSQFSSTASSTALFTPDGGVGDYILRWTISNAPCTPSTDEVTITVETTPATPGAITGSDNVNPSTSGLIYSITAVPTATSYTWTVPTGWAINSGQGSISISATSGAEGDDGNITVTATNSCGTSTASILAVTVTTAAIPPTITLGTDPTVCQGTTSADLSYSATTEDPDQYSIDYDATAESEGFIDIVDAALPASPIVHVVPGGASTGTYNGTLTVKNSSSGLSSSNYPITVTIITTPATPGAISGSANVNPSTSGLVYSISAVPSADTYTWTVPTGWTINSGQGTVSISATSGTEGQDGDITVTATNTCGTSAASTLAVTVTAAALAPTITLGTDPTVCQGTTTAALPYSATTENPDLYSINYFTAAEDEGFVDVVDATLPASPIIHVVPGGASPGTYYGNLTVKNSGTGLSSGIYSISVTIIVTPAQPAFIFGNTTVPETTEDLSYGIVSIPGATSYNWSVPTGWTITSGQGTTSILVTSGTAGQNGDIAVYASSPCGDGLAQTLAVTSETPVDHSLYGCNGCHMFHEATGGSLTSTLGNSNLCLSCHVSGGAASTKPFVNADKAIPGVSGNSHAWDVASVNTTYETVLTTDPDMVLRVDAGNITCSTCHDQHNANGNINYTRVSNAGDAMCKDCHSPRAVGRYIDNTTANKGSHPVGLAYSGIGDYEPAPTGSAILVGGNIECSSCHNTHFAATSDGMLLRQTNDNALCTSCHTLSTHNGMNCLDCHQTHNTNKSNIYMIRDNIVTPASGTKAVVFTALTGSNSYADGDGTYDGICEVCHDPSLTPLTHFLNDGSGTDQDHTSQGLNVPLNGNCTTCHPHNSNFSPSGGGCVSCHESTAPTYLSTVHVKHKDKYACTTCHLNYGSGGSLEGSHPSGTIDINFNPDGMATRMGQDANTPSWTSGSKTCGTVYCHSNGVTTNRRGMTIDGTFYDWRKAEPDFATLVYASPAWTETITDCDPCHAGNGNMTAPYTINASSPASHLVSAITDYPGTGALGHRKNAHLDNDDLTAEWGTSAVQCFWCHNYDGADGSGDSYQGTYGTEMHVDGEMLMIPIRYNPIPGGVGDGTTVGSFVNGNDHGINQGHCANSNNCY